MIIRYINDVNFICLTSFKRVRCKWSTNVTIRTNGYSFKNSIFCGIPVCNSICVTIYLDDVWLFTFSSIKLIRIICNTRRCSDCPSRINIYSFKNSMITCALVSNNIDVTRYMNYFRFFTIRGIKLIRTSISITSICRKRSNSTIRSNV